MPRALSASSATGGRGLVSVTGAGRGGRNIRRARWRDSALLCRNHSSLLLAPQHRLIHLTLPHHHHSLRSPAALTCHHAACLSLGRGEGNDEIVPKNAAEGRGRGISEYLLPPAFLSPLPLGLHEQHRRKRMDRQHRMTPHGCTRAPRAVPTSASRISALPIPATRAFHRSSAAHRHLLLAAACCFLAAPPLAAITSLLCAALRTNAP